MKRNHIFQVCAFVLITAMSCAIPALSQHPSIDPLNVAINNLPEVDNSKTWIVFGRVTTLSGQPIGGAKVQVNIDLPKFKPEILETNLQGEFKSECKLGEKASKLSVEVVASKSGFTEARESAQFNLREGVTHGIGLMMRETDVDADLLTPESLIASLAPRFLAAESLRQVSESVRKEYEQGAHGFLDGHSPERILPILSKVVEGDSSCLNCRLLLGLAQIQAGSWSSAHWQLAEAESQAKTLLPDALSPELPLVLGVRETWRHDGKAASEYFQQALKIRPSDPLVLQEYGRALMLQKDWENADQQLERAIQAGAPGEAHLLRAKALMEEGDPDAADAEMNTYIGDRRPQDLPSSPRMVYLHLRERLELKTYGGAISVVKQNIEELQKAMPELKGLEAASSQEELSRIMARVGEHVENFFRDFPNTISTEETQISSLRRDGSVRESATEKADYLMLARAEKRGLGLTEYRTRWAEDANKPVSFQSGSMRTAGFASTSLLFHPTYQPWSEYRYLGQQEINGQKTYVVAFAQQPEKAEPIGRFDVNGMSAPVLLQGIAWVEPNNFQILRMRTDLLKPLPRVRLVRQSTEIHFAPVDFKEVHTAVWLPQEVTVTVQWKGRTFRNSHRYSDFKLFNVGVQEKRKQALVNQETVGNPN